jgi:hypothetical protein
VGFNTWAGFQKTSDTLAHVQSVYGNALTITRDKEPNLK